MKRLRDKKVAQLPEEVWVLVAMRLEPADALRLMRCTHRLHASFAGVRASLQEAMAPKLWYVERHDAGG